MHRTGLGGVIDAFHRATLAAGATAAGAPGPREEYGEPYQGCFVRDLDGYKIEAACWNMELYSAAMATPNS